MPVSDRIGTAQATLGVSRFARLLLTLSLGLACAAGCGKGEPPRLPVYPVTGKLLVNGKPAVRAEVSLRPRVSLNEPTGRSVVPNGSVEADGTFHIGTYLKDDGAPAGEYALTVVWPQISIEGGEEIHGPDRLRDAYRNPVKPATKVTVQEHENQIPLIDLKSP